MKKAISIHIGLNNVDKIHYEGTGLDASLNSCNKDALDMAEIAKYCRFETPIFESPSAVVPKGDEPRLVLLDNAATTTAVITSVRECAKRLEKGDTLLITYAGHGGQIVDVSGNEGDGLDETWCLYDRQFLDEEFFELLTEFREGVRIIVVSDSCNNGTVIGAQQLGMTDSLKILALKEGVSLINTQNAVLNNMGFDFIEFNETKWNKDREILTDLGVETSALPEKIFASPKPRTIRREILAEIRRAYKDAAGNNLYDQIQREVLARLLQKQRTRRKKDIRDLVEASVVLISACQDWQFTSDGADGNSNGFFTKALKETFADGNFSNYIQFHEGIWNKLKNTQSPNYYRIGSPNSDFELIKPFTV